mmetsp:Transcript_28921/g.54153  ORF Transcript_28921/g.54153 Transcript_28921/m.54153 type:complete len:95 (-) Transcript_28921:295-579(-)
MWCVVCVCVGYVCGLCVCVCARACVCVCLYVGVGLSESVQVVGSLMDRIDNINRTIEGLTVKKSSEGTVDNMKVRLRELKKQMKRIDQKRSEFG